MTFEEGFSPGNLVMMLVCFCLRKDPWWDASLKCDSICEAYSIKPLSIEMSFVIT